MNLILHLFILIPFLGYLISLVVPAQNEHLIAKIGIATLGTQFSVFLVFIIYWLFNHHPVLNHKDVVLYQTSNYEFYIDVFFDRITAMYMFVGTFLTFLITIYSRAYLHREIGYKRFFNTIIFFYIGYTITILSGNLETLFIGWEILGIASFLLIGFYRERYNPAKNALKVFTIYRIGDVGLLLAMWLSHHLFHQNISFLQLQNYELVNTHLQTHSFIGALIALMILVTAAAKSALLPFSSWLPRAMEGPTPSSAIFYGSLSVHLGVFLMLRTFPFWEHQYSIRVIIGLLGLITSIITSSIARVQSSIKSQVAYSSISQIGLIFIEVAAGFENLALFHFAGNAFLRTYQLLVSPSVVSYLIREQFFNFIPYKKTMEDYLPKKLKYTYYVLCLKEWNLDSFMFWLLRPFKLFGRNLNFLSVKRVISIFVLLYTTVLICLFYEGSIPEIIHTNLPAILSIIGLAMVIKSFTERNSVLLSWVLILMNHFWIALAISFNEHFKFEQTALYLSGIILAGIVGFLCIRRLKQKEGQLNLNQFQGHIYEHPKIGFVFLLACLGLTGFPITTTFIGEDLIFSHVHENQIVLAIMISLSFVLDGLAVVRIYSRVFLGPHIKTYHESHFKSS
jgi:NADH-quinone oxidoreductase subunit L